MRISIVGTRGIPARYGGNEVCAEQIGARLTSRGHEVAVYCRGGDGDHDGAMYKGMRRVFAPSLGTKHLDTLTHTLVSALHARSHCPDIVQCFGVGNAALLPLLNRVGARTVISVDGMDWRRAKWGRVAKLYLRWCSGLAVRLADACVTDSRSVAQWYRELFGRKPLYIPHGAETDKPPRDGALCRFGLEEGRYILFVGRLVPEKGVHHLIEAFTGLDTDLKLAIVGDGSGMPDYLERLRAICDTRVRLLGPVYGEAARELYGHGYAYVQPSLVEGTSLSLVEAMGYGNCVLVSDIPENLETIGHAGLSFDSDRGAEALRETLAYLIERPDVVREYRRRAIRYARQHYSWKRVTDAYERLYMRLLNIASSEGDGADGCHSDERAHGLSQDRRWKA